MFICDYAIIPAFIHSTSQMLEVKQLSCEKQDRLLFNELSFTCQSGIALQIQGKNGAGKTSLLRLLAGLEQPQQGDVLWQQQSIYQHPDTYYQAMSYVGHKTGNKSTLTARENLSLSLFDVDQQRLEHALQTVGLAAWADVPCGQLSSGQQRRLALARLLCRSTAFWILDEPFTALDTDAIDEMSQLFAAHVKQQGLLIFTSHQSVTLPDVPVQTLSIDR